MENLKTVRLNSKKTQIQVSQDLGLPMTTYATYEQGKAVPNLENLKKIADYFGCSVDYLIGHQMRDSTQTLPPQKRQLINDILQFDDEDFSRVEAYVEGIKSARQEEEKLKKRFQQSEEA